MRVHWFDRVKAKVKNWLGRTEKLGPEPKGIPITRRIPERDTRAARAKRRRLTRGAFGKSRVPRPEDCMCGGRDHRMGA